MVFTKTDLVKFEDLKQEDKSILLKLLEDNNINLITMSNVSGDGVANVKTTACDILLQHRLDQKPEQLAGGS